METLEEPIMSETAAFTIGSEVTACDGVCGELRRVVVNPVARALTHLVVEPKHRQGTGHLVPIDLVDSTTEGIHLRCTTSEFQALEDAEETQFLPGGGVELRARPDALVSVLRPGWGRHGNGDHE